MSVKRIAYHRFYQALLRENELLRMGIIDKELTNEIRILKEIWDSMSVLRNP